VLAALLVLGVGAPTRRRWHVAEGMRVSIVDLENGDTDEATIQPGQYVLFVAAPCHLAGEVHHRNGTTVLTLKGCDPSVLAGALARSGPSEASHG
jgi:hypothetical protein